MKKNSSFQNALIVAIATVVCFASSAFAQSGQNFDPRTSLPMQVSSTNAPVLSQSEMQLVRRTAVNTQLLAQLTNIGQSAKALLSHSASSMMEIANGGNQTVSTPIASTSSVTIEGQHIIRVQVSFEPRPVGGILNVRLELVPRFSGVGVANRPLAQTTIATAVDHFDANVVSQLVQSLSASMTQTFASNVQ